MTIAHHPLDERILALDLSLTHTGVVAILYDAKSDRYLVQGHETIVTPSHSKGSSTPDWNLLRYRLFSDTLVRRIDQFKPHVVVVEITKHAYPKRAMKRGGVRETTRGEEYKAGYGLGRAVGWLDAVMEMSGIVYEEMDAGLIKLRIAGSRTASKEAAKDGLKTYFGYDTEGWSEHEVDALACGIAWVRQREGDEKLARAREGAEV